MNSFMMPTTLRLAVLASRNWSISDASGVTYLAAALWAASTSPRAAVKRAKRVAVGTKGSRTGSRVVSFTYKAIWGRQNTAVAYQSPNRVVESSELWEGMVLTR